MNKYDHILGKLRIDDTFDDTALRTLIATKADATHTHAISEVTNLETRLSAIDNRVTIVGTAGTYVIPIDDIRTDGIYRCLTSNAGRQTWNILFVKTQPSSVQQWFIDHENTQMRTRTYSSGAWSSWTTTTFSTSTHTHTIANVTNLQSNLTTLSDSITSVNTALQTALDGGDTFANLYRIHLSFNNLTWTIVCENYNSVLLDSTQYKVLFMHKRKNRNMPYKWVVPAYEADNQSIEYAFPITGKHTKLWNDYNSYANTFTSGLIATGSFNHKQRATTKLTAQKPSIFSSGLRNSFDFYYDQTADAFYFRHPERHRVKYCGFAIYKKISGKWLRISNIAYIALRVFRFDAEGVTCYKFLQDIGRM